MENFDRENIDELLEIRQIRQYFPPSKFCAVRYIIKHSLLCRRHCSSEGHFNADIISDTLLVKR